MAARGVGGATVGLALLGIEGDPPGVVVGSFALSSSGTLLFDGDSVSVGFFDLSVDALLYFPWMPRVSCSPARTGCLSGRASTTEGNGSTKALHDDEVTSVYRVDRPATSAGCEQETP